tara:strand:- start:943 stop:1341 length:399 start_codon:yes stop_codon:yes gene_type:complete
MNPLINLIYICLTFYYLLPQIHAYTDNLLIKKGMIVIGAFILQLVFHSFVKLVKRKSLTENFRQLFDVSVMSSLLVLLGFSLVNDFQENPEILKMVPGLEEIISSRLTTLIFMAFPFIAMKTSKCFLKTYSY